MAEGNPAPGAALYWPPETPMEITTQMSGDITVVSLHGAFTADHGVPEFAETMRRLIEGGHSRIVVNCQAMSQAADAWLTEMVRAYTVAARNGGTIKITSIPKRIGFFDLLLVTKLSTLFELSDTDAEAFASFGGDKD